MTDPLVLDATSLNPCRYCAGARTLSKYPWRDPAYWAECDGCDNEVAGTTEEDASDGWNAVNPLCDVAPEEVSVASAALLTQRPTTEFLTLPLHPCNTCGADASAVCVSWHTPPYRAFCQGCPASKVAETSDVLQAMWNRDNPSTEVTALPNSKEQRRVAEKKAAARRTEIAAFLAQRLTPEVLDVLRYATAAYAWEHRSDDFSPNEFIEWCCRMGNKPCPDELHEEAYAYMSSRDSGIFGAVTDTE